MESSANFLLSSDLVEFKGSLRGFFSSLLSAAERREYLIGEGKKSGVLAFDEERWKKVAEMGVLSATVPEGFGGLGLGYLSAAAILEEIGYSLLPLPVQESLVLGVIPLTILTPNQAGEEIVRGVVGGTRRLTGAFEGSPAASKTADSAVYALKGDIAFVPNLAASHQLLLRGLNKASGSKKSESSLFSVSLEAADQKKMEAKPVSTLDIVRGYSSLSLNGVGAQIVVEHVGDEEWQKVSSLISALVVCEMVGAAEAVLDMTLSHAKTRKQFGRSIGSFQAVQHKFSDIALLIEQAKTLARFAVWSFESDPSQFLRAASATKAFASEALPRAVESALQIHGGIGFTYEYDLHLYLRRIRTLSALFGTAREHSLRVAEMTLNS